eukprot:XP_008760528.1 PREDICTED: cystatin-F isoform X2 [Rattus norvegicus]
MHTAMWLAMLLALCCLTSDAHGAYTSGWVWSLGGSGKEYRRDAKDMESRFTASQVPRNFCSKDLNSGVEPGFPKTIKTNNPGVLKAARHSVEKFNNCTNDIFLFKESHVSKALVQVVKGLKYMLQVEIGRTTCRKTMHRQLDNCDFQTSPALKRVSSRVCTECTSSTGSTRPHLIPEMLSPNHEHRTAAAGTLSRDTGLKAVSSQPSHDLHLPQVSLQSNALNVG